MVTRLVAMTYKAENKAVDGWQREGGQIELFERGKKEMVGCITLNMLSRCTSMGNGSSTPTSSAAISDIALLGICILLLV